MSGYREVLRVTDPAILTQHRARWFAVIAGQRYPRTSGMRVRNGFFAWDVVCSCGWDSSTGGAIQADVQAKLDRHRWDAEYDASHEPHVTCTHPS